MRKQRLRGRGIHPPPKQDDVAKHPRWYVRGRTFCLSILPTRNQILEGRRRRFRQESAFLRLLHVSGIWF